MGQTIERKIGVVGGCSFMITLPKGWIRFHNLKASDKVLVVTNGKLIVKPLRLQKDNEQTTV